MKARFNASISALAVALAMATVLSASAAPAAAPFVPPGDKTNNPHGLDFIPKGARTGQWRPGDPVRGGIGETVPYKSAKEQWEVLKAKYKGGVKLTGNGDLPDWSGVWRGNDGGPNFDPSLLRDSDQYGPLSPDNQAYYDRMNRNKEINLEWDTLTACLPNGWPRFVASTRLKDFAITPKVVFMMNEQMAEIRRIYTDGRDHRPDDEAFPLWEGDSIGFWTDKGDKADLIVWTNHMRANIVMRGEPRLSNEAETIEIWHKVDDKHINLDLVVYDPSQLTRPWLLHRHYIMDSIPDARIDMWVCAENNGVSKITANGGTFQGLPTEQKKDPDRDPIIGDILDIVKSR
jgi:hypothetical protein